MSYEATGSDFIRKRKFAMSILILVTKQQVCSNQTRTTASLRDDYVGNFNRVKDVSLHSSYGLH